MLVLDPAWWESVLDTFSNRASETLHSLASYLLNLLAFFDIVALPLCSSFCYTCLFFFRRFHRGITPCSTERYLTSPEAHVLAIHEFFWIDWSACATPSDASLYSLEDTCGRNTFGPNCVSVNCSRRECDLHLQDRVGYKSQRRCFSKYFAPPHWTVDFRGRESVQHRYDIAQQMLKTLDPTIGCYDANVWTLFLLISNTSLLFLQSLHILLDSRALFQSIIL